jgi:hypothetical protein
MSQERLTGLYDPVTKVTAIADNSRSFSDDSESSAAFDCTERRAAFGPFIDRGYFLFLDFLLFGGTTSLAFLHT